MFQGKMYLVIVTFSCLMIVGLCLGLTMTLSPPPATQLFTRSEWTVPSVVWNMGLASLCDHGVTLPPEQYFSQNYDTVYANDLAMTKVEPYQTVWIRSQRNSVQHFVQQCLDQSTVPFILVMGDSDDSFPSETGSEADMHRLIYHPHIVHIFAQNCDYTGESTKVSPLPIGVDLHTMAFKPQHPFYDGRSPLAQSRELYELLNHSIPTRQRKLGCFVDFQLVDSLAVRQPQETRTDIFHQIKKTGLVDFSVAMPRSELWRTKSQYAFSVSPHGRGLDCHRTWEDLWLGCIVIVKTSVLDPLYEGLPVVIVRDWSEFNATNLEKWRDQFPDAATNLMYRSKLTNHYWYQKIREKAQPT